MLSQPECSDKQTCELQTVVSDVPSRTAGELRTEQLKDLELKKIIDCFEDINESVDFANWTERGLVNHLKLRSTLMIKTRLHLWLPFGTRFLTQKNAFGLKTLQQSLQRPYGPQFRKWTT
ncbi:hypothetical protein AVEN_116205-1 [Araneus ventricosus]|uniref:Uncharacterized protein n=1 Tax=Araneus ventricosus TaxID=182803 RepID=A0A4Y2WW36_ARAVE|nr:hypothetical protein AVEN_116205-1 [Araneus ventricosus]